MCTYVSPSELRGARLKRSSQLGGGAVLRPRLDSDDGRPDPNIVEQRSEYEYIFLSLLFRSVVSSRDMCPLSFV